MSRNSYDMDDSTRNENAGNNSQNRSQNNRHYRQLHSCRKTRYDFLGYRGLGIVKARTAAEIPAETAARTAKITTDGMTA